MYNIIFRCFVSATVKLYSNAVIQPLQYKCVFRQYKFSVSKYIVLTRGCCISKSHLLNKEYDEKCEEELNEYIKNPANAAKFEKCKLEVEYLQNTLVRVPTTLKAKHWLHLLKTELKGQRRAYLAYLWQIEKKTENEIKKKLLKKSKKLETEKQSERLAEDRYQLSFGTLFHRIRSKTIMDFYNSRLINAMLHSSEIVFDLGYENNMTQNELQQCTKQLLFAFSENRSHDDPYNLYFCNVASNSLIMKLLHKTIPTLYDPDFPLNITSKSYLEVFDKSRLVYLSPHCRNVMTHYDPNAVYIIGAMIDKTNRTPLSFQKARKEGLKMAKFPLSQKLQWGSGSIQTLPLNQVLSILLDLRSTNNWDIAFQHIPKRKLKDARVSNLERKLKKRETLIHSFLQKN